MALDLGCGRGHISKYLTKVCKLINISNSNWTKWSAIQGVITRVILKSDEQEARGQFEITHVITP